MEKYEKVKKIGKGTFGNVYLVKRKLDGQVNHKVYITTYTLLKIFNYPFIIYILIFLLISDHKNSIKFNSCLL